MKFNNTVLIIIALIISNCTIDGDATTDNSTAIATWHLIKSESQTMGTLSSFELGTIIWIFNDDTKTITVENNNTDDAKYDLLDTGTYNYEEIMDTEASFILIDEAEYDIAINDNIFSLAQDSQQGGVTLDSGEAPLGNITYTFQRVLIEQ